MRRKCQDVGVYVLDPSCTSPTCGQSFPDGTVSGFHLHTLSIAAGIISHSGNKATVHYFIESKDTLVLNEIAFYKYHYQTAGFKYRYANVCLFMMGAVCT